MTQRVPATARAPRHAWLYALPGAVLPARVWCAGDVYEHVETFKHDFFAGTGLYRGPAGMAVLKMGRSADLFTIPMSWAGAFLMRREVRCYARLHGDPGVPRLIGCVGRTGFLHAFVPGHPLGEREAVSEEFFPELQALLARIHAADMAYVDLNKRQNILVGDDGRPYLIDFQISLWLPAVSWRRFPPFRWLLGLFQDADWYHLYKHKRRLRPDQLQPSERERVERRGIWIRMHRAVARPLTQMRRAVLARLKRSEVVDVAGSSAK